MNKLPWFTHDHDAHEDGWIRNLVRKQGHVAGWLWWVLIEQFHKHGVGDILKRNINDLARAALTSNSVLIRVLTEMGTEFEGQSKVKWKLVGTELELKIKKFRERQSKLKSKIPLALRQSSPNVPVHIEEEGEIEGHRHNNNKGERTRTPGFVVPTIAEVVAYCQERKNSVDPEKWLSHYTANGWMVGRNKMKNWKASICYWEKSQNGTGQGNSQRNNVGDAKPVPGKYGEGETIRT